MSASPGCHYHEQLPVLLRLLRQPAQEVAFGCPLGVHGENCLGMSTLK